MTLTGTRIAACVCWMGAILVSQTQAQPFVQDAFIGDFAQVFDVAVDRDGTVVLTDAFDSLVHVCKPNEACTSFGGRSTAVGEFQGAAGVDISAEGQKRIYIADSNNFRVQRCDFQGNCEVFAIDIINGDSTPFVVSGLAIDNLDRVYLTDISRGQILRCNTQTGNCEAFGAEGTGPGQFLTPTAIDVDGQYRMLITDRDNDRVQVCDQLDAATCRVIGGPGDAGSPAGSFNAPAGIHALARDLLVVSDPGNRRAHLCTYAGLCTTFGEKDFESNPTTGDVPFGVAWNPVTERLIFGEWDGIRTFSDNFSINPSISDAWYDPNVSGQGFLVHVFDTVGILFIAWFTFDTERPASDSATLGESGQRWLTLQGPYSGNTATLDINVSRGGVFASPTPPVEPAETIGSATVTWLDCRTGVLTYDMPGLGLSGTIEIRRVVVDSVGRCLLQQGR